MDPDVAGARVAELLTAASPAGVKAVYVAEDGMLWYSYEGEAAYGGGQSGSYWRVNLQSDSPSPDLEDFLTVCMVTLDQFQDYVAEATGTAWPGTSSQPNADSAMVDGKLRLFFGDLENPVLVVGDLAPT